MIARKKISEQKKLLSNFILSHFALMLYTVAKCHSLLYAVLCLIKVKSNTIEITLHTSCFCVLDLLCVI